MIKQIGLLLLLVVASISVFVTNKKTKTEEPAEASNETSVEEVKEEIVEAEKATEVIQEAAKVEKVNIVKEVVSKAAVKKANTTKVQMKSVKAKKVAIKKIAKKSIKAKKADKLIVKKIADKVSTKSSSISSTVNKIQAKAPKTRKKPWTLATTVSVATSLKETEAASDFMSSGLSLSLSYKLNNKLTAQGALSASKDLKTSYDDNFSSAFVGLNARLFTLGKYISGSGKVRAYLPVNKTSRDRTSFRGRAYTNLGVNTSLKGIGLKNLSIYTSLTAAKNIHEFEYTSSGSNNTSYYSSVLVSLDYSPISSLGLSIYGSNTNSWDYDNFRRGNTYLIGQTITYSGLVKGLSISAGHEIGGSTYGYNGKELDLELLDKDKSSVFTSLTYVY